MRYTGGMVELSGSITQAETMERSPTRKVFPRSIKSGPLRRRERKESEPWDVALNFIASVKRRRIWRQRRQIACESCVGVNIWGVWTGFLSSLGGKCVGAKRFGTPERHWTEAFSYTTWLFTFESTSNIDPEQRCVGLESGSNRVKSSNFITRRTTARMCSGVELMLNYARQLRARTHTNAKKIWCEKKTRKLNIQKLFLNF